MLSAKYTLLLDRALDLMREHRGGFTYHARRAGVNALAWVSSGVERGKKRAGASPGLAPALEGVCRAPVMGSELAVHAHHFAQDGRLARV